MALDSIQRAALLGGYRDPSYEAPYGGVPGVPNPVATAGSAIGGNLGNLGSLYGLGAGAGRAAGAGAIAGLNEEIPGVSGTIGTATGNINQLLSGYLSPGDISNFRREAAEIGQTRGVGAGSPNTNLGYLTTVLGESQARKLQGLGALNALMTSVPRAPAFDPSTMLVNPRDQQEAQYLSETLRNAPKPGAAARANLAALQGGTGVGGPTGGFLRPAPSGPAFNSPMLTGDPTGNFTAYGPQDAYTGSPDPYAAWRQDALKWGGPTVGAGGMSDEDFYGQLPYMDAGGDMSDEDYYDMLPYNG